MNKTQNIGLRRAIVSLILIIDLLVLVLLFIDSRRFAEMPKSITIPTNTTIAQKDIIGDPVTLAPTPEIIDTEVVITPPISRPIVDEKVVAVSRKTPEMSAEDRIKSYVNEITYNYPNVKPELVKSIIYHESRYNPKARNGNCVGLMQVSTYWHADRAKKLGVNDFYDPYSNIVIGVDYISELLTTYKDPSLVLMLYNMNHDDALRLYSQGKISDYAKSVLSKAEEFKKGV